MDTKFKKTALDDDALIYQRSKDSISREDIKKLPLRQRFGYFRDYYLKIVAVAVLVIIAVVSLLNTTVFNRSESVLSICFLNGGAISDTDALDEFLEGYIGLENKNDYIQSETLYLDSYQMNMAFITRLAAGAIDLVVCPYSDFLDQSQNGMFCDLRELLPEDMYEQLSDRILENGVAERDGEGEIISRSDPIPFGIDLSDSAVYKEYGGLDAQPVLCAAANVKNTENALKAIAWFTGTAAD